MQWSDLLPPPFAVKAGLTCLVLHVVFAVLFRFILPSGPWTELPHATAHQLVCLPLMLYLLYHGCYAWFTEQDELYALGMEGRIFGVSERGVKMSEVVYGMMLFWDIPLSLVVPSLQDNIMLMHHIGMCFVSAVSLGLFSSGRPIGSYYAAFFCGVIEFSSVLLAIVDLFHPKNKAWFLWINESKSSGARFASMVNEVARVGFAVSFLVVRCGFFPYVVFSTCLRDFWAASMLEAESRRGVSRITLWLICALNFGFTIMQLNWGILVAKHVMKALGLIPSGAKKKAA